MANNIIRWFIYCEPCSFKQIVHSKDPSDSDLVEIKTSPIPGGSPVYDSERKKTVIKSSKPQNKKFKCPRCGRGIVAKKLPDVYVGAYRDIDEQKRKEQEEYEKKKRVEDGTPIRRSENKPDFLG